MRHSTRLALGAALVLALGACSSEDSLGSKNNQQNSGGGAGTSGSGGGGGQDPDAGTGGKSCSSPSPEGCTFPGNACQPGFTCDTTQGCTPSSCSCDATTGTWICTADCGGGICVPDGVCSEPGPVGCKVTGCAAGEICDTNQGCAPSWCGCDPATKTWTCTDDCGGGVCVPDQHSCPGENPQGCATDGCPSGQKCDTTKDCVPSGCGCDPSSGLWVCTADCGGGVCVPS